jgi:hypothetical protein
VALLFRAITKKVVKTTPQIMIKSISIGMMIKMKISPPVVPLASSACKIQ